MKILFLHGAVKNAGDFLIAHRSQLLIQHCLGKCDVVSMWEGVDFDILENRKILNSCDGIVFGGGPFFTRRLYPHDIPLVKRLDDLNMPMINIGGGWYGSNNNYNTIKYYNIDNTSQYLLKKIENSSEILSCRDWLTVNMLIEKGYRAEMHGCPAWYDLDYMGIKTLNFPEKIETICVSDPADARNIKVTLKLIEWLKESFPTSKIIFVCHRGKRSENSLNRYLAENNIEWKDISDSCEGFKIYDSSQLHIGFRVHAHIYNLSHRKLSILIEEDGRGGGVNQALGLNSIHAYSDMVYARTQFGRKLKNKLAYKVNENLFHELNIYLKRIYDTKGFEYDQAFERMQMYLSEMQIHIQKISKW